MKKIFSAIMIFLEVMHTFWKQAPLTVADILDYLKRTWLAKRE